MHKSIPAKEVL